MVYFRVTSRSVLAKGFTLEFSSGVLNICGILQASCSEVITVLTPKAYNLAGVLVNLSRSRAGGLSLGGLLFEADTRLCEGSQVRSSCSLPRVNVGSFIFGGIYDSTGNSLLTSDTIQAGETWLVQAPSPGIIGRDSVFEAMQTGTFSIDALVPIGRGQRELCIGDRQTGKSSLGLDAMLNQKLQQVFCVYVAVGQKSAAVLDIFLSLYRRDAAFFAAVVAASAAASPLSQFFSVYRGAGLLEFFMLRTGIPNFLHLDDLSKHAISYREIYLLLRRPPGREAFPGEIFFVHSRLLERSAKVSSLIGGGSITAMPMIETLAGDVSAYISTNVISITDGQIFLSTDLFLSGIRPAVEIGISVTRVGSAAQTVSMKLLAGSYKVELSQFNELASFSQFASDLGPESIARLEKGRRLVEMLKQGVGYPIKLGRQVFLLSTSAQAVFSEVDIDSIKLFVKRYLIIPNAISLFLPPRFLAACVARLIE